MSQALALRLREATVVLNETQLEEYEAAISKLATGPASVADQLTRLRLTFNLRVETTEIERFDAALTSAGLTLDTRDHNLRRVLAGCVLIARFGRGLGKRKRASIAGDTLAALGAQALHSSRLRPVHPDVVAWAGYWIEMVSQDLRSRNQVPDRPTLTLSTATPSADGIEPSPASTLESWRTAIESYATELAEWNNELDPAHIAAHEEQLSLLWWLQGNDRSGTPEEAVVSAASDLLDRTSVIPGPPRSDQLLTRRLASYRDKTVKMDAISQAVNRTVEGVDDLCPLLSSAERLSSVAMSAPAAAQWLFVELTFLRMIGEAS